MLIMFAINVLGSQSQHCQVIFMFCVENIYSRARDFVINQVNKSDYSICFRIRFIICFVDRLVSSSKHIQYQFSINRFIDINKYMSRDR